MREEMVSSLVSMLEKELFSVMGKTGA
jgi:hypothetical protein